MSTTEQLSENSHQGFEGIKAALCLAEFEANSNRASGMAACLRPNGTGSRCSGKERDAESGLDYFGERYFSSPQGRFTAPDLPFLDQYVTDPQSWNLYAYVRNNPLINVDPTGGCSIKSGDKAATDDPGQPCIEPASSTVTVTAYDPGGLSPAAQFILASVYEKTAPLTKPRTYVEATLISAAAGTSFLAVTNPAIIIDGIAYTEAELAGMGEEVLAKLLAAGKITQDLFDKLQGQISQASDYLFARSVGLLNSNPYLRIGWGWSKPANSEVFRISIGGKGLPIWKHIDLFKR
jgi:RHS repeat-associated protein